MKKRIIYFGLFSIIILAFVLLMVSKVLQNDTFFSIACGRKYLLGDFSRIDTLTWHENLEFTNSRWLYDIILAKIYEVFSFTGIHVFVCIIAFCEAITFFAISYKISKKMVISFIATLFIIYINNLQFVARAHEISIFLVFIEFLILEKLRKNKNKFSIFILFLISVLIANLHGTTFPISLLIYLPYFAEFLLFIIMKKMNVNSDKYIIENINVKYIGIAFLFSILGGFCTINGLDTYTYIIKALNGVSADFSLEMKSLNIIEYVGFYTIIMIAIAIIGFSKTKIRVTDIFFILGLGLMTLNSNRALFYFQLITEVCVIRMLTYLFKEYEINFNFVEKKFKVITYIILGLVYVVILLYIFAGIFNAWGESTYIDNKLYPVDAVKYIKNNLDINQIKIFNSYNNGSYLEFMGVKSFIDSRAEMFTPSFNENCNILTDYDACSSLETSYNDLAKEYGITHFLLYNGEALDQIMELDTNWKNIYQDDYFVLYEKVN